MKELIRTKINNFSIDKSVTIEQLKNNLEECNSKIIKIEELFQEKEKIDLNDRKIVFFLNGVQLTFEKPNGIYRIYNKKVFIGLGIIKNNLLKRDVIL